jgi:hypothetical protein
MEDTGVSRPDTGLVYEDLIPLSWRLLDSRPDTAELLAVHQSNERILRCLTAVDESRSESGDEEQGPIAHDIARLDIKINLLLDMMGRLLSRHVPLPDPVPIRMYANGLQWRSDSAPERGSLVEVELYLSRRFPSPIVLRGRVDAVTPAEGGQLIELGFGDISEPVRNWLEKLIFRQHRRQVAHSRKTQRESSV